MKKSLLLLLSLAMVVAAPAWGKGASLLASSITIKLNNLTDKDDVSALVAKLEKNAAYKAAACGASQKDDATTKIDCAKADSRLMSFLSKNAPPTVQWSITSLVEAKCVTGCVLMNCPPPNGTLRCCNTKTYAPC